MCFMCLEDYSYFTRDIQASVQLINVMELAEHGGNLGARFCGLTRKRLVQLAFYFAEFNALCNRFNAMKR
jgi:hypothetical protein